MPPEPATTPTVWTIKALLTWTAEFLTKKGITAARLEAQILLAHVLSCPRIELVARSDEVALDSHRDWFRELIKRRVDGWPVAYLTGEKEFYLLKFNVTPAVLIPRPDTELLVLEALRLVKPLPTPAVLDLGTGSGCIGICIAHQKKDARVTLSDISPDALEIARANAKQHGLAERLAFHQGDLFDALPADATFDVIVSNPPYVTPGEIATLAPDVRDHEPRLALDGGPDGLAFYRRIAAKVESRLKPSGSVLVEIGETQNEAVRNLFAERPGLELGPTLKDAAGHTRVVTAKKLAAP